MKYFFLILPLIASCSFYSPYREVTLAGIKTGRIVLTSSVMDEALSFVNKSKLVVSLRKGENYYATYYPEFYGREGRFPFGAILDFDRDYVTFSPHLGLMTMECNALNRSGKDIDLEHLTDLKDLMINCDDPWRYNKADVLLVLSGDMGVGSISSYPILTVPELSEYLGWESENRLFSSWYPSVHSFYNRDRASFFRLELFEDGSYNGFEEVK